MGYNPCISNRFYPTEFVFGSPYVATKKALNAFMRDVSMQVHSKGIRTTTCLVGSTKTAIIENNLTGKDILVGSFAQMGAGKPFCPQTCES